MRAVQGPSSFYLPSATSMSEQQILDEFYAAGALRKGHFVLSSGLHSEYYFQCARIMMDAKLGGKLCDLLASRIRAQLHLPSLHRIVSPAMGGILVGYELGRQMNVPSIFVERVNGDFKLRRGFDISSEGACLVVEDIITTGGSAREAIAAVREHNGNVVGAACLIDRSGGKVDLGVPLVSLATFNVPNYSLDNLPPNLQNQTPIRPGSRGLA